MLPSDGDFFAYAYGKIFSQKWKSSRKLKLQEYNYVSLILIKPFKTTVTERLFDGFLSPFTHHTWSKLKSLATRLMVQNSEIPAVSKHFRFHHEKVTVSLCITTKKTINLKKLPIGHKLLKINAFKFDEKCFIYLK